MGLRPLILEMMTELEGFRRRFSSMCGPYQIDADTPDGRNHGFGSGVMARSQLFVAGNVQGCSSLKTRLWRACPKTAVWVVVRRTAPLAVSVSSAQFMDFGSHRTIPLKSRESFSNVVLCSNQNRDSAINCLDCQVLVTVNRSGTEYDANNCLEQFSTPW